MDPVPHEIRPPRSAPAAYKQGVCTYQRDTILRCVLHRWLWQPGGRQAKRAPPEQRADARRPVGLPWTCVEGRHPAPPSRPRPLTPVVGIILLSAGHWTTGRFLACSIRETHRSPDMRTPARAGYALCLGDSSGFHGLHRCRSFHHTACQHRLCRSGQPQEWPGPVRHECPATHRSRLEYVSHDPRLTMPQIPKRFVGSSPRNRADGERLQTNLKIYLAAGLGCPPMSWCQSL